MALADVVDSISTEELVDAQAHIWNHIFNFAISMCLKCAIQLGIPDIINKHGKPIKLSDLSDAIPINKAKSDGLRRLMRILVQSNFFHKVNIKEEEEGEEGYSLTLASRLLLTHNPLSFAPYALAMIDPVMVDPYHHLMEWFQNDCPSPFVTRHGSDIWELGRNSENWNQRFNEAMATDARFVGSILVEKCKHVFEGLETLVDVAGGTGSVAKAVSSAFPGLKCTVFDLPQVVAGLEESENLRYESGNMFEFIPPADAVFLKWVLHDWSDEECVKILKRCKEAITGSKNNAKKVIIVEMVVDDDEGEEHKATETKLLFDIHLMVQTAGKQRSEKEWTKLFFAAGFHSYTITPVLGLRSVIQLFLS